MKKNKIVENRDFEEFLVPISFLLRLSCRAYEKYMANKIYLHALNIRKANEMIYKLVLDKINIIPVNLQQDCIELLNHYDCWFNQFSYEQNKRQPLISDEFVFLQIDNQVAYPRSSEKKIMDAYKKFKKQLNK